MSVPHSYVIRRGAFAQGFIYLTPTGIKGIT